MTPFEVYAKPSVSARNAVLMEQETGRVLYQKQAHEKRNIASITKIMTAIVAIESGYLDETAVASRKAVYTEGSSIYLEQGEKMSVEDLVYGLMLRSGNDAAIAIAEEVGGSLEGFVHLMNEKANWIGMKNSHFANPHGLDEKDHYSTAYDMALLMRYAMENDIFRKVSGTTLYKAENRTYAWGNKNKLLTRYYDYCTGGKTGFTKISGRTLVTTAEKNGMELIMVTLNGPDDWNDHRQTFEWGFKQYSMKKIQDKGEYIQNTSDIEGNVSGYIWEDVLVPLTKEEAKHVKQLSYSISSDSEITPVLGKVHVTLHGKPIVELSIMSSPKPQELSLFDRVIEVFKTMTGAY